MPAKRGRTITTFGAFLTPMGISGAGPIPVPLTLKRRTRSLTLRKPAPGRAKPTGGAP